MRRRGRSPSTVSTTPPGAAATAPTPAPTTAPTGPATTAPVAAPTAVPVACCRVAQAAAARQTRHYQRDLLDVHLFPRIRLVVQRDDSAPHAVLTMQRAAAVEEKGNT